MSIVLATWGGGRGKSGGVRIIYFVVSRRGVVYLIKPPSAC
jgi:mRNA-degrading endonuclease RelE of RelBE toxin-antitoxin system